MPLTTFANTRYQAKPLASLLLLLATGFIALVVGAIVATDDPLLIILVIGAIGAVFLFLLRMDWIVWFFIVFSLLIAGIVTYLRGGSAELQWLNYLMGWMLYARLLVHLATTHQTQTVRIPNFVFTFFIFLAVVILSIVITKAPLFKVMVASKEYFSLWGMLFIFMTQAVSEKNVENIWKLLIVIAILQLPASILQYLFVSLKRGFAGTDAVAGTFGGNIAGGSPQGYIAAFLLVHTVMAFEFTRNGILRSWWFWATLTSCLAYIVLAEVKFVMFAVPVLILMLYWRELVKQPQWLVGSTIVLVVFVIIIPQIYQLLHYSSYVSQTNKEQGIEEMLIGWFDPYWKNPVTRELGRVTQFTYWWHFNGWHDWYHTLFGYGMGSTQVGRYSMGGLALQHYYSLNGFVTDLLLWETGFIGMMAYLLIFVLGSTLTAKLAKIDTIPLFHRIVLRAHSAGLLLIILLAPYNSGAITTPAPQLWIILMLGHTAFWYSRVGASSLRLAKGKI